MTTPMLLIRRLLPAIALAMSVSACGADPAADDPEGNFDEASSGAAITATCPRQVDVVVYAQGGWNVIADALRANPSPCADYWVTIPSVANASHGRDPRGPVAATAMRDRGPRFHAVAEFNWSGWREWVAADATRSWYQAGVAFREQMAAKGYLVERGDTWAVNEFPSALFEPGDPAHVRGHARDAVRGLFEGPRDAQTVRGAVFIIGRGPLYKANLEELLSDQSFWNDMSAYTRWWGQESYVPASSVCVSGTTVAQRAAHLNAYNMHQPILALAGGATSAAALRYLRRAYVPILSGAWQANGYGVNGLSLEQVEHHLSTAVFATRAWAGGHLYPGGRVGLAWTYNQPLVSASDESALAARAASAIAGAYGEGGGQAARACSPTGAYTWCQCNVDGARFDEHWASYSTW